MTLSDKEMNWILLLVVLGVMIIVLPRVLGGFWGWSAPGMTGMMGYGWGFMVLIPIMFLVLIAIGVYYAFTGFGRPRRSSSIHRGRALEILKERYAKGEITREQYLEMKKEVES